MKVKKAKNRKTRSSHNVNTPRTFGPVSDLEQHLPSDWWRSLFNSLYLKTDGDVVENHQNTVQEIDYIEEITDLKRDDFILDLCCGQGRHSLELARRGYQHVTGIDRSRYLIRLARKRAGTENLDVVFHEGDARRFQSPMRFFDYVILMGNSFGYFERQADDESVLRSVARSLNPDGQIVLDLVDGSWMRENYEKRSWEWIDENHFVCRERALTKDQTRIISREVITHAEKGVLADQFYAERIYSRDELEELLDRLNYRDICCHDIMESHSTREQDLGMMARRMFFTATAPVKPAPTPAVLEPALRKVTVLMGDPALPDNVKVNGQFNDEDFQTIEKMQDALKDVPGYNFKYFKNHKKLIKAFLTNKPEFVLNLCDEGYMNDPFKELHVTAFLEMLDIPYTGANPSCLGLCYNKSLVRAISESLDVPTPLESYVGPDDNAATLPSTFPALLKPNFGDSSVGITRDAVVYNADELLNYVDWIRDNVSKSAILIQEYLTGTEYSIGIIGNPGLSYTILPPLEVDYSSLDPDLPQILGYESKWLPDSPYWQQIRYKQADLKEETQRLLFDYSNKLFTRLGCRDYARFDFRSDAEGNIKLLEVNPNPGWCWDGKMNIMAEWAGISYSDFLMGIVRAAEERYANL